MVDHTGSSTDKKWPRLKMMPLTEGESQIFHLIGTKPKPLADECRCPLCVAGIPVSVKQIARPKFKTQFKRVP